MVTIRTVTYMSPDNRRGARVLTGTDGTFGRIIQRPQHETQRDRDMSRNRITPHAKVTELTADQMGLVHGGIILIGGKAFRSHTILTFSSAMGSVARWSFG
jgi:hypothetical protein